MPDELGVQDGYNRWAKVYDHDANPLQALEEPLVINTLGPVEGLDVLDVGCGTGRHALRIAAAGGRVTGVDFSEAMLAEAREKPGSETVRFVEHDLSEPLPFDREFDLVVSGLVLEHILDLDHFYGELQRVLRRPARAVLSFMHPVMFLKGSQARFTDPDHDELVLVESIMHTVSETVMAALGAGFAIEQMTEHTPNASFAEKYQRAKKYLDVPMLVVQVLKNSN